MSENCLRGVREVFLIVQQQHKQPQAIQQLTGVHLLAKAFSIILLFVLHPCMKPTSSWCLWFCSTRHPLSNRHHGFCIHVPSQHVPYLPVDEGLELGEMGKSYTHFRRVSFWVLFRPPPPFIFIFYDFKSFAWVVATLFGVTGYATFTTLSQGTIFST